MARRVSPIAATRAEVKPPTPAPKVYPVAYVAPSTLKGADYNPRKIEVSALRQLAHNIARFGFIESVSACKEDNELIGGHQRVKAALMLLSGEYVPRDDDGKPLVFKKPETIPVIYIEGLSINQRKTVNLSLNRISGEWDHDKVVSVVKDLHAQALVDVDETMKEVDRELKAIADLMLTGFSQAEIEDYLDVHAPDPERGRGPLPAKGVPKLTLEFTSKETRDAFKSFLSAVVAEDEPSGDSIARRLGIALKRKGN